MQHEGISNRSDESFYHLFTLLHSHELKKKNSTYILSSKMISDINNDLDSWQLSSNDLYHSFATLLSSFSLIFKNVKEAMCWQCHRCWSASDRIVET